MSKKYLQQVGTGVASLTFGVALLIFIYAAVSGRVVDVQSLLLYVTSFLLMLRFWWRYTDLFVQHIPSKNYWEFMFDFLISFFGILAVLFVNRIEIWGIVGAAAMLASMIRCGMSWGDGKKKVKKKLKRTFLGSFGMFLIFSGFYFLISFIRNLFLAGGIFVLVLVFVVYNSLRK